MSKPVVDNEMVERCRAWFLLHRTNNTTGETRAMLEAALAEPDEIPVTPEMLEAGYDAVTRFDRLWKNTTSEDVMRAAYPAMEAVRRKAEKPMCGCDFVNFVALDEFLHRTPGSTIGAVKLCRKCYRLKDNPK